MQWCTKRSAFCAWVVLACGYALGAQAATHPPLSLGELVQQSDATLLGHVTERRSFWQGTRILTSAQVAVDELWAGGVRGARTVDVVSLGGSVGPWGQRVDGAAVLPSYGRVVLHLRQVDGEYTPTAMAQGVWHVHRLWGDEAVVSRAGALPLAPLRLDTLWPSARIDGVGHALTVQRLRAMVGAVAPAETERP